MKITRLLVSLGLGVVGMILPTGCATSKLPTVDTWQNSQFTPTPGDSIALTDHPASTRQDQELDKLLLNELKQENFAIVSADQADYLLAYVVDQAVQEQTVVHSHPFYYDPMMQPGPLTPQTDAQMIYQPLPNPLPDRAVTFRFTSNSIRLRLYTNPKTHHGDFQLVWQGNVDVPNSVSAAQEQQLIKAVLAHFGSQYDGRIRLNPHG
jgi:hypothetical protein